LIFFAEIGARSDPFPGLRPFEVDESPLFFGRSGQSQQLIAKLIATCFLSVVGTSASGSWGTVKLWDAKTELTPKSS